LLQLWSYERFPIGRPYVYVDKPFGLEDLAGTYVPAIATYLLWDLFGHGERYFYIK